MGTGEESYDVTRFSGISFTTLALWFDDGALTKLRTFSGCSFCCLMSGLWVQRAGARETRKVCDFKLGIHCMASERGR